MKKPHELPEKTTRRGVLGILGGFAGVALGAAPFYHQRATLDVDVDILGYGYGEPEGDETPEYWPVDELWIELSNETGEELDPLFTTWDQRRRTRHNWPIDRGETPLPAGETSKYRLVSPGDEAALHAGLPAQLTVWRRGEEVWHSVRFTPSERGGVF